MAKKNLTISDALDKLTTEVLDLVDPTSIDPYATVDTWAPSGIPSLDERIKTLGFPTGIIELSGKSRSGKTTMAACGAREFLHSNKNGIVLIAYTEQRYNTDYLIDVGLDMSRVRLVKTTFVEDMYVKLVIIIQKMWRLYEEGVIDEPKFYIIWDSQSSTYSREEKESFEENVKSQSAKGGGELTKKEAKNNSLGSFAKAAKKGAKYFVSEIYEKSITFIVISHTMVDLKSKVGARKSSGGEWIEYMPTLRLELSRVSDVKVYETKPAMGQNTKVKVIKNDFGRRGQSVECEICFGFGFILSKDDLELGIEHDLIIKKGYSYSALNGKLTWKGKKGLYELYQKRNPLIHVLQREISKAVHKDTVEKRKKIYGKKG